MRRLLLPLALVLGLTAVQPASAAYKIGISDQGAHTFANPLFAPLKLKMARYVTPWDVMKSPEYLGSLTTWVTEARKSGQRMLVAFESSHTPGQERKAPSVAQYTKAIKAFKKAFPDVRDIQPWNEVNRCQERRGDYIVGQPICKNPKKAAQYYMAARKVFKGAKVTGLDILDQKDVSCRQKNCAIRYIKEFLKFAKPHPRYWGVHNYSDTNRGSMSRTKAILKATKRGDIWLTETGGIVSLGSSFRYNPKRAAKALGCMFSLAKSNRRITRLYVYHFNGLAKSPNFDAGLINPPTPANPFGTKRPGYDIVKKRKASRCRA